MLTIAGGILLALLVLMMLPAIAGVVNWLFGAVILVLIGGGSIYFVVLLVTGQLSDETIGTTISVIVVLFVLIIWFYFSTESAPEPFSRALSLKKKLRQLKPALTDSAKLEKIANLQEMDTLQREYTEQAIRYGESECEAYREKFLMMLEHNLKEYLAAEVIELRLPDVKHQESGSYFHTQRNTETRLNLEIHSSESKFPIADIEFSVIPKSTAKTERFMTLRGAELRRHSYQMTSDKRALKLIKKVIFKELSKHPELILKLEKYHSNTGR